MELAIHTTRTGPAVRLRVRGDLDLASAGLLQDAVNSAFLAQPTDEVELDLAEVSFIDSSGMGTLVACQRLVQIGGGSLRLRGLTPRVHRQLFIAGLLGLFGIDEPGTPPGRSPVGDDPADHR